MILPYIYVYRLTFTGQSWFIVVGVCIKDLDGEIHAINKPFYLVSQVEFLKNVKVTFRKDCHLAGIQGFQSVKFLGEYLALNNVAKPHWGTCWRQRVIPLLKVGAGYLGPM